MASWAAVSRSRQPRSRQPHSSTAAGPGGLRCAPMGRGSVGAGRGARLGAHAVLAAGAARCRRAAPLPLPAPPRGAGNPARAGRRGRARLSGKGRDGDGVRTPRGGRPPRPRVGARLPLRGALGPGAAGLGLIPAWPGALPRILLLIRLSVYVSLFIDLS